MRVRPFRRTGFLTRPHVLAKRRSRLKRPGQMDMSALGNILERYGRDKYPVRRGIWLGSPVGYAARTTYCLTS
jgi:hypothetical protein